MNVLSGAPKAVRDECDVAAHPTYLRRVLTGNQVKLDDVSPFGESNA